MSDLAKIIGILIAIPAFIIAVIVLLIGSLAEGMVIEEFLKVLEASPIIIGLISVIGVIVLISSIFILIKNTF